MKKKFLLFFALLLGLATMAQQEYIIQGYIYDAKTKKPIEFANVGIVSKGIGTISRTSGFYGFTFSTSDAELSERLQISILGYEKFNMPLGQYIQLYGEEKAQIYLQPAPMELEEVNITNEERKYETIGFENLDNRTIGYWKDKKGLGGEIGTRIRIKKERTKLLNLYFKISENYSDSLRVRVNIYDYKNKYPGKNILAKPIYYTISKDYGIDTINLKPYNIIVDEDVVVSLELIEIYGDRIGLALFGSFDQGTAYLRLVSQDNFDRQDYVGMGFWLDISRPKSSAKTKDIERDAADTAMLFWDASAASAARNFEEELELLKDYVRKQKAIDFMVVKFAMGFREKKRIRVDRRNWDQLEDYLLATDYDGDSDFKALNEDFGFKGDVALMFSNGLSATSQLIDRYEAPLFAINTNTLAADAELKDVCRLSGGHYINLSRMNLDQALRYMTYDLRDNLRYAERGQGGEGNVFGIISNEAGPLPGAYINVIGTFKSTVSKADGSYVIDAEMGELLKIDYLGMKPKQLQVDQLGQLNIQMQTDGELLDEVLVEAEATSEKEIIDTPFGERDVNSIGYDVQSIGKEQIGSQHVVLDQLIAKLPGVIIEGIGDEKRYTFARLTTGSVTLDTSPIIVVDGITYQQGTAPLDQLIPPIDLQRVESITALKSVVASNRYGSLGAYGAIVIKTEASSMRFDTPKKNQNTALVSGNDFDEDLPRLETALESPQYVVRYKATENSNEAKELYQEYKKQQGMQSVSFFINSANYFRAVDGRFAKRVLSNLAVLAPNNVKVLKTYAFWLEERMQYKRALEVYETIYRLRPFEAQSRFDLARIQARAGQHEEAFENLKFILINQTEGVDYKELGKDAEIEMKRLLNAHKDQLNTDDLPAFLLEEGFKQKIRISVEWNDPLCEFELQFVNPDGKFYSWNFDSFSNADEIARFRRDGIYMKTFEIAEDAPGIWQFNLRNIGAANMKNPAYLKYTIYLNYGTEFESQRTKVVNLAELPAKVVLDRFTNKR